MVKIRPSKILINKIYHFNLFFFFRFSNNPGSETSWPNCSTDEQQHAYDFNNDPYLQQPHDFNTSLPLNNNNPYPLADNNLAQNYAYNFFGNYGTTTHENGANGAVVISSGATVTSNDPLILTTTDNSSENGSYNKAGGGGRIMREIIV